MSAYKRHDLGTTPYEQCDAINCGLRMSPDVINAPIPFVFSLCAIKAMWVRLYILRQSMLGACTTQATNTNHTSHPHDLISDDTWASSRPQIFATHVARMEPAPPQEPKRPKAKLFHLCGSHCAAKPVHGEVPDGWRPSYLGSQIQLSNSFQIQAPSTMPVQDELTC